MNATTTRRAVLAVLTGAGVAVTAAAIPAAAMVRAMPVHPAPVLPESAELLALGDQINPALAAYRVARDCHAGSRTAAEANCPPVPDELVCKGPQWAGCTRREVDVEGEDIWPPNYVGADGKTYARPPRGIFNSVDTKAAIERGNLYCDGRTKFGKQLQKRIRTAEQYEAERKDAIDRSSVRDAANQMRWAAYDLDGLAVKISVFAPVSTVGIIIQARVLAAQYEVGRDNGRFAGRAGSPLGQQLADAVLRVQGEVGGMQAIA